MAYPINGKEGVDDFRKKGAFVRIDPIDNSASTQRNQSVEPGQTPKLPWQPGFRARFPWLSLACLCGMMLSSVGAVLVLWRANNRSADIWNKYIRPNALLTLLNSASSILITTAVGQGVAIAWWRRALKGSTVKELHYSWSFSTSLSTVIMKFKYFNVLALAALMTKIAVIDGILFQQSLGTYSALSTEHEQIFYAYSLTDFPDTAALYPNDTKTVQNSFGLFYDLLSWQYSSNEIFQAYGFQECQGICAANFATIGFVINCDITTQDVDIVAEIEAPDTDGQQWPVFGIGFDTISSSDSKNYSYIQANVTTYKRQNLTTTDGPRSCPASLETKVCELRPALINYPIVMQQVNTSTTAKASDTKDKVMLGRIDEEGIYDSNVRDWHDGMNQLNGFEPNRTIDFEDISNPDGNPHSRLAGITEALKNQFASSGFLYSANSGWQMAAQGPYANVEWGQIEEYIQPAGDQNAPDSYPGRCPSSYGDPMGDIIFSLNTLMFILSDDYYNRDDYVNSTVIGSERTNEVYYSWNWQYTIGAVVSTILCILCILPAYWGFWELGRKVTLGPFEIANAFEAPVLAEVHQSDGNVEAVLKAAGQESVQYVARDGDGTRTYLRFEVQDRP